MSTIERNTVVLGDDFKGALSLAVAVDRLVDDEWVDDRTGSFKRADAVANSLVREQRKIVGGVVSDHGDALCKEST